MQAYLYILEPLALLLAAVFSLSVAFLPLLCRLMLGEVGSSKFAYRRLRRPRTVGQPAPQMAVATGELRASAG